MKTLFALIAAVIIGSTPTLHAQAGDEMTLDDAAAQISKSSGLPTAEVQRLLSDCAANQQSITFCAWRDRIEADEHLLRVVARWGTLSAACSTALTKLAAEWKTSRDELCATSPSDGSGAMAEIAECQASMTKDYADHFTPPPVCHQRGKTRSKISQ